MAYSLPEDDVETIPGLTVSDIQQLCSQSIFNKSKRFEVNSSNILRTQTSATLRCINGQFRGARIHEQSVFWGSSTEDNASATFNLKTIKVYCSCRYFTKTTCVNGFCCSHIIGQLRRTLYLTKP